MAEDQQSEATASAEMLEEYKQWKAMGAGGMPHTWAGFMMNKTLEKTIAYEDTISVSPYHEPTKYSVNWGKASEAQKQAAQKAYLQEPLPTRPGPRARAKKFVIPQRERNEVEPMDEAIKTAYQAAYQGLGDGDTEWKTSLLEKHGTALFLKQGLPLSPLLESIQREICHIHTTDMSGHVSLSLADAQEVVEKGWGERHRLSGTNRIPLGYTMVYVPNTLEETAVLAKILQAGVDYVKAG